MSMTNVQLITCDLCQRRYNINVYQRHRNENQCLKRNQQRIPFESIKQRSIQIGDQIYSVEKVSKTNEINRSEKQKQQISINKKVHAEKLQRRFPLNYQRRTLEQAKLLLERRTKYKPAWIEKRTNVKQNSPTKTNRSNTIVLSTKQFTDQIPPTTKFPYDDLPIKISDRHVSPQLQTSSKSEQINFPSQTIRKAYTWTRSSKQTTNRDIISPIQIPTFSEASSGPSHERTTIPLNQNYDDDEFERYSPTPPSTPKYFQNPIERKNVKQPIVIRPNTYHKAKRTDRQQQQNEIYCSTQTGGKKSQSIFHLPPINPSSYSKLKHRPTINPTPWR